MWTQRWRFALLRCGEHLRAACSANGKGREQKLVCAEDVRHAIELMGKFDGFSRVGAWAGQRRQGDAMGAEGYEVVGGDDAPILQAEAAGEVEASGQAAEVGNRVGGRTGEGWL